MASVIDRDAYSRLLAKFQPKVIESREKYDMARHTLLELMAHNIRTPEQTSLIKLIPILDFGFAILN